MQAQLQRVNIRVLHPTASWAAASLAQWEEASFNELNPETDQGMHSMPQYSLQVTITVLTKPPQKFHKIYILQQIPFTHQMKSKRDQIRIECACPIAATLRPSHRLFVH